MDARKAKVPRWALDKSGVQILGLSLCLWAEASEQFAVLTQLRADLASLGSNQRGCQDAASMARAHDFLFRWNHFRDFPTLVGFVKPGLPDWADWDQKTPISLRRAGDPLPPLLCQIFAAEVARLTGPEPDYSPDPQSHKDRLFYLTIHELCVLPARRGHPKGRTYRDGLASVTNAAYSILFDAEQNGDNLSVEEACKRAREILKRDENGKAIKDEEGKDVRLFERVTADKFEYHPRKEWVLVAANEDAAQRRVRESLGKMLEREGWPATPVEPLPFEGLLNKALTD